MIQFNPSTSKLLRAAFAIIEGNEAPLPCGECVECCRLPEIIKDGIFNDGHNSIPYEKPAGELCKHCTGKGCGIYEKRPSTCQGFVCTFSLGICDTRPNKTGIVFGPQPLPEPPHLMLVVGYCESVQEQMNTQWARERIEEFLQDTFVGMVTIRDRKEAVCFMKNQTPNVHRADIDPADPLHHAIINERVDPQWGLTLDL